MSVLEDLKQKLQRDISPSEIWYHQNKVEQFQYRLQALESNYNSASKKLTSLEIRLSAQLNNLI